MEIDLTQKHFLLFDGDCGVCSASADLARVIDKSQGFHIAPYQDFPENSLSQYGLDYAQCDKKVQVITKAGRRWSGAFAVNYFLWRYWPWKIGVFILYALPFLLVFEVVGYAIVAKYRSQISRLMGLRGCRIAHEPQGTEK